MRKSITCICGCAERNWNAGEVWDCASVDDGVIGLRLKFSEGSEVRRPTSPTGTGEASLEGDSLGEGLAEGRVGEEGAEIFSSIDAELPRLPRKESLPILDAFGFALVKV